MKIGILGSCTTRDAFEFATPLACEISCYLARTNFRCLSSAPWIEGKEFIFQSDPGVPFSEFRRRLAEGELLKTHRQRLLGMVATLDVLILDLIDDRFDSAVLPDGRCVVLSPELLQNATLLKPYEKVCFLTDPRWQAAWVGQGCAYLQALRRVNPDLLICVHRAPLCFRTNQGKKIKPQYFMRRFRPARFLEKWAEAEQTFIEQLQRSVAGIHLLEVDPSLHLANADHRWGIAPFHYVDGYYHEFIERFLSAARSHSAK